MNTEELITTAAEAIRNRPMAESKRWKLCHYEGRLVCIPITSSGSSDRVFCKLSNDEIHSGLTVAKWNQVGNKLKKFYKEASPCTQPTVSSKLTK